MIDFIVKDGDDIVGKYRRENQPNVPDHLSVEEVDNVSDNDVVEWWDEQA